MPKYLFTLILILCCNIVAAQRTIDLSGQWSFGTGEQPVLNDCISLPNSMISAGKGNEITAQTQWTGSTYDSSYYFNPAMERYRVEGNVKFPFFLTPAKHYVGTAWYERTVTIPRSWKKRPVVLFLERPHIETTVFVNGREVGHQLSLSTPHEYDITSFVRFGRENTIRIRVYNGIENVGVGQDSHSVTDQTQGNWNGIVGRIELRSRRIGPIRITADVARHLVNVKFNVAPRRYSLWETLLPIDAAERVSVIVLDENNDTVANKESFRISSADQMNFELDLGSQAKLWDEFHPHLYRLHINISDDERQITFGIRDISIQGRQFYLNGKPIWMRGTVENCCFPETGYPPTDEASWLRIFEKCREYGLNHMRFHSYCPPEAAFAAADKVGFYLQPEGPSWPNHGVCLRRGQVIDEYLLEESKRIIDTYGHHPSFVMMAAGNEPAGDWVTYCNDWVKTMKQYDPTKVYCGASVGGGWAWDDGSEYHVKGGARGLDWDRHAPHSDDDYYDQILYPRNYHPLPTGEGRGGANNTPIIAHEQGQWCAFPDFKEIEQYTGAYKARNFEIFRDLLADNGMASQAERFLNASGKLQVLSYKYEIERNLRTPDYAGFQLLGLNDYSGQGTALVGPLNVHWREKSYIDATSWREFCSPVVPLARFPKFVYENNETLSVPVEFYNASGRILDDVLCTYSIHDDQQQYHHGVLSRQLLPEGKNLELGNVEYDLSAFDNPTKLTLTVSVQDHETQVAHNHWDFWVYPNSSEVREDRCEETGVFITDTLDEKAFAVLQQGGDVLILAAGKVRYGNDVVHRYLPVFWNTSWFKMRPPHTTGANIDNRHPLFREFPTDDWQNLNWWELVNGAQVMNLSEFPRDYQPIVQPIDTWHVSRKLGMLFEARVLNGRVVMTTIDIARNLSGRPVARQLRQSILSYMQSTDFQPELRLEPRVITNLFERTAPPVNMFTNESPDELKPALK